MAPSSSDIMALPASPSFDPPSSNREDMQRIHTGQAPPPANTAGHPRTATEPRKLSAHEQELEDVEKMLQNLETGFRRAAVAPSPPSAPLRQHHRCHLPFPSLRRCFANIEITAHYSCGTGYSPSIDPLRHHRARKQVVLAKVARRAYPEKTLRRNLRIRELQTPPPTLLRRQREMELEGFIAVLSSSCSRAASWEVLAAAFEACYFLNSFSRSFLGRRAWLLLLG
jgi:hypothetical protein